MVSTWNALAPCRRKALGRTGTVSLNIHRSSCNYLMAGQNTADDASLTGQLPLLSKLVGGVIKSRRQNLVEILKDLGCDVRVATAETVQVCLGKT